MSEISETVNHTLLPQPVIDIRFAQLQLAKQRFPDKQNSPPKIQKVPAFLRRDAEFAKYYSPKIISFGPIHYNDVNLKQGEDYKLLWTSLYIEDYCKTNNQVITVQFAQMLNAIQRDLVKLKKLFTEDSIGTKTSDEDLAWMLFVDGCSLLHFMKNIDKQNPEALQLKLDQMMHIWRDIFMLENQLPRTLLELLSEEDKGDSLESLMKNFYFTGVIKRFRGKDVRHEKILDFPHSYFKSKKKEVDLEKSTSKGGQDQKPIHILDYARRDVTSSTHKEENGKESKAVKKGQDGDESEQIALWLTHKNIRDLKTAGIRVMANETNAWKWSNISFTSKRFSGELKLPMVVFDNDAPYFFRNLIAYETSPDFHNELECCSFVCFMDSLIDNAEDVKELRLAGVIQNLLGSDDELAKLFNDLGRDLTTKIFNNSWSSSSVAYSKKYIQVKDEIENHYKNKWRTGFVVVMNTHFNNPWSTIAFLAAVVALVLTFIQTWYAVYPKK